jgi:hypothetical protein
LKNVGSLHGGFLAFRPGAFGPEETTDVPADQKDNACEGSTDDLKRKQPGTRVNVRICRFGKSTEHSQYLNDK